MEVCRLEVLLQYMKRDINKLILLLLYYELQHNYILDPSLQLIIIPTISSDEIGL